MLWAQRLGLPERGPGVRACSVEGYRPPDRACSPTQIASMVLAPPARLAVPYPSLSRGACGGGEARVLIVRDMIPMNMDANRIKNLLQVWVVVALVAGVGAILLGRALMTAIGVVLVILGLMSLMPAIRFWLKTTDAARG